tara:strand:+ start:891 stop:1289 length:399 start_codon:yes stop_codon:yes gene_type:complete
MDMRLVAMVAVVDQVVVLMVRAPEVLVKIILEQLNKVSLVEALHLNTTAAVVVDHHKQELLVALECRLMVVMVMVLMEFHHLMEQVTDLMQVRDTSAVVEVVVEIPPTQHLVDMAVAEVVLNKAVIIPHLPV